MKREVFVIVAILSLTGCASHSNQTVKDSQHSDSMNMAYMCPMHPDVVSTQPGKCSKCGMMLVATQPTTQPGTGGHVH